MLLNKKTILAYPVSLPDSTYTEFIKKLKCILDGELVNILGVLTFLPCSENNVLRELGKACVSFHGSGGV